MVSSPFTQSDPCVGPLSVRGDRPGEKPRGNGGAGKEEHGVGLEVYAFNLCPDTLKVLRWLGEMKQGTDG